jgi:hypothetical protein
VADIAARPRGYSLILLAICAIATSGWVALPDGVRPRLRPHRARVGIAFFACHGLSRGFRDYEISLLAAAQMVPLLSRGIAGVTGIPLGVLVMLAVYVFALRRALQDGATIGARSIAQA